MPFAARFPNSQVPLPKETYLSEENNLSETKECPDIMRNSTPDGGFACIAQAAWLLDQVFKTLELSDIDAKLLQLDGLDHTLRTYLTIVIDQAEGRWGRFCTAIAIVIR